MQERVLIVDDDEAVRTMLYKVIRSNGMDAVVCASGAEALKQIQKTVFDLILLDVNMPGMDGFQVVQKLRSQKVQTPYTPKMFGISASQGAINRIANLLLVVALAHVDASVQYPMVTGGTMLASTLICFFGPRKPSKKELISVTSAFVGLLILFVVPV